MLDLGNLAASNPSDGFKVAVSEAEQLNDVATLPASDSLEGARHPAIS
jgi:hypothetical protein